MIKIITVTAFAFLATTLVVKGQETGKKDSLRTDALNVFINCPDCDMDYIRKEITFINYVRDQKDAQLYILETGMNTGSGGEMFSLYFIGQKEFLGKNDTLTFTSAPDETNDEVRIRGKNILKLGLMQYVARTPQAKDITISFESSTAQDKVADPWKSWVFKISGSGYLTGEEARKDTYIYSYFNVSKITEKMKFELNGAYNFYETDYKIADSTIKSIFNSKSFSGLYVKSLGEHWSLGGSIHIDASTYSNKKLRYGIFPAIEYNLFKYSESNRRQLRFLYETGAGHIDYIDTTLYGKIKENLPEHALSVAYEVEEKWGSVSASVYGSQYLHDLSKNNLSLYTSLEIRIFKGLTLTIYGNVSLIHDQLNLPKTGVTEQEILTRQKELASQYYYYGSIGLTYTFGSIYNNVVNPRFGN